MTTALKRIITIPKDARVLVVEDSAIRINWFREHLDTFDLAVDPKQGLDLLETSCPYDIVFLDHDASWDEFDLTFMPVAERLKELNYQGELIIHTYNPVGAKRMQRLLRHGAWMPYGTFDIIHGKCFDGG
jgi:CheY-like chemotaxis protein